MIKILLINLSFLLFFNCMAMDLAINENQETLLMQLIEKKAFSSAEDLLNNNLENCNINAKDKNGETALVRALSQAYVDINFINLLLKCGADPKIASNSGFTPLMCAANQCEIAVIELLCKYGADETILNTTNDGKTTLTYACNTVIYTSYYRIKYLIKLNPKVLELTKISLSEFVLFDNMLSLSYLLSLKGADFWGVDNIKEALEVARQRNEFSMEKILLNCIAESNVS